MSYDCKALANLLFPNVKETEEDLEIPFEDADKEEN